MKRKSPKQKTGAAPKKLKSSPEINKNVKTLDSFFQLKPATVKNDIPKQEAQTKSQPITPQQPRKSKSSRKSSFSTSTASNVVIILDDEEEEIASQVSSKTITSESSQHNELKLEEDEIEEIVQADPVTPQKSSVSSSSSNDFLIFSQVDDPATPITPTTPSLLDLSSSSVLSSTSSSSSSPYDPNKTYLKSYYKKNFFEVVESVYKVNPELFYEEEKALLETFFKLSEESQRLFIRVYNRKGPWFSSSELKLKYLRELVMSKFKRDSKQEEEKGIMDIELDEATVNNASNNAMFKSVIAELAENGMLEVFDAETHKDELSSLLLMLKTEILKNIVYKHRGKRGKSLDASSKEVIVQQILDAKYELKKTENKNQSTLEKFFKNSQDPSEVSKAKAESNQLQKLYSLICKETGTQQFVKIATLANDTFKRIHRLYFLNGTEKANIMILETMQVVRYPTFQFAACKVFKTRNCLNEFEKAQELENSITELTKSPKENKEKLLEEFYKSIEGLCKEKAKYKAAKKETGEEEDAYLLRFRAGWIYTRCCHHAAAYLETWRMYDRAILYYKDMLDGPYCIGKRGKWWNRLALDLSHISKSEEAATVCLEALRDPFLRIADRLTIEKRLERLGKSKNLYNYYSKAISEKLIQFKDKMQEAKHIHIQGQYPPDRVVNPQNKSKKSVFLSYDLKTHVHVEELAIEFYQLKHQLQGIHCEGSIFAPIFGLLFWDIIFDDSIPNVFQTKYQEAPLDLLTDAFYLKRKDKIERRLEQMQNDSDCRFVIDTLLTRFTEYKGIRCSMIHWDNLDVNQLVNICYCIGAKMLSKICRVFAEDYKHSRRGFPDLILYEEKAFETSKVNPTVIFCEVKGPRDRLSDYQNAWIDVLVGSGGTVHVLHIVEVEYSKKQKTFDDKDFFKRLDRQVGGSKNAEEEEVFETSIPSSSQADKLSIDFLEN